MTAELMASWLLATMLQVAPPGRSFIRDAVETPEDGARRYAEIAQAVSEVVLEEPPLLGSREQTAMLLLSVAWHESGFRKDVDHGVGPLARGDGGKSCTLWQFNLGAGSQCEALLADRRAAARRALAEMRRSKNACGQGPDDMLRVYASGRCSAGATASRVRVRKASEWLAAHPPPMTEFP